VTSGIKRGRTFGLKKKAFTVKNHQSNKYQNVVKNNKGFPPQLLYPAEQAGHFKLVCPLRGLKWPLHDAWVKLWL
jgi:hypothetical protein